MKTNLPALRERIKAVHAEYLILFHLQTEIRAVGQDAVTVASQIGTILTKREGVPATSFSPENLHENLIALIRSGHKVALAEPVQQTAVFNTFDQRSLR